MADWRVVTPQRVPTEDELGEAVVSGSFWLVFQCQSAVDIQYHIRAEGKEYLRVRLLYKEPAEIYDYSFAENRWQDAESSPIDITTVDLTIPESAVSSATIKTPYFDLIAYEKGTTACKLAVAIEAKTLIRNALSSRGINVSDDIAFRKYAGMVEQIGGGTCMVTATLPWGGTEWMIDHTGMETIVAGTELIEVEAETLVLFGVNNSILFPSLSGNAETLMIGSVYRNGISMSAILIRASGDFNLDWSS